MRLRQNRLLIVLIVIALLAGILTAMLLAGAVASAAPVDQTYLPVVQHQTNDPRPGFQLSPPSGIRCFHHDTQVIEATDGSLWWNSQCQDGRGQLVFRTDASGTALMHTGSEGGLATMYVGSDGWLYLAVGSLANPRRTTVEPVTGWQP